MLAASAKIAKTTGSTVKASEATAKAAKKTAEKSKKTGEFIARHKKGFLIAIGIVAVLAIFLNIMSSCSVMFQAGVTAVGATTYPCEDSDMLAAEAQYCAMEAELQQYLDTYESTHDYDEYHFDLDTIDRLLGMNITFVTTAPTDEEGYALLKEFGLPFKNANNK